MITLTPEELRIIGKCIDGHICPDDVDPDEDDLIYGSNTWPVYRIKVSKAKARQVLDEYYKQYAEDCRE